VSSSDPVSQGQREVQQLADIAADKPDRESREQDDGRDGDVGEPRVWRIGWRRNGRR
jgi:hypothetical protein